MIISLPVFTTKRLYLRPVALEDAQDMYDYARRENVGPRAGWKPHGSIEETKKIIAMMNNNFNKGDNIGVWSIVNLNSQKMIGTVGLQRYSKANASAEIGYVLNPDFWGKGIMKEAVCEIIKWSFDELNLHRVECGHYDFNLQSKRVIEKLGFTFEGISREKILLLNGKRCDLYNYSILKSEYKDKTLPWL